MCANFLVEIPGDGFSCAILGIVTFSKPCAVTAAVLLENKTGEELKNKSSDINALR